MTRTRHPATAHGPVFPDRRDVIAADARRYRSLTPPERWAELFAIRAWGHRLTTASPRGEAIRSLEAESEAAWQTIQKELFARHGG